MTDPEQLRAMLANATKGPWQVSGVRRKPASLAKARNEFHAIGPDGDEVALVWFDPKTGLGFADAKLIVAAVNALPALLDEHEKMRAALEDIVSPLAALQRDAEAQGAKLSGMAYQISCDPEHLKRIARAALASSTRQEDDGNAG